MIPTEKSQAVSRALHRTFGVSEYEDISVVTGGHTTSLVFRIVVRGTPYLLKMIMRNEDPTRHFNSMRSAAEAGLAPRVWYTNSEDRIFISDFVNVEPLPISQALVRLPALLRTLHALPPFDRAPFNTTCTFLLRKGPALDGYLQKVEATNVLPKAESEEFFARYSELAAVIPLDDELVASHNDLFKPDNILFDGQCILLVDWEAAFLNDRYADLAVVANHVVTNDDEESIYLREYFGAAPDEYQRARFHLMQQLAHLFYALAYLYLGSMGRTVDWSGVLPGFVDFHRSMWAREVDLTDKDVKIVYGRLHWERLLHNVRQPRYREALSIVSAR